ncbi:succinate--CoA ligase subunit alpha [Candidatus Bipolaricaulota bacterium]
MAIFVDKHTQVLIQGITGRVGSFQAKIMLEYGTRVVAGVTPGKGGTTIHGIPVYDFVEDACYHHEIDVALCFVPARFAKDAAVEAIDNDIPLLVLTSADIPDHEILQILSFASTKGTRVLGPDTPGLVSPGACKVGVHPNCYLREGSIGVVSKSGALSYEVCKQLAENGFGQSSVVGIGGGPFWDITYQDVLDRFNNDPETQVVILVGEVGGTMEYSAASFIREGMAKPVISLIVGRAVPRGTQMGHAGAIIERDEETADRKIAALERAGSHIARTPAEIVGLLKTL